MATMRPGCSEDGESPPATTMVVCDISIILPCLNETQSLPHCVENARAALAAINTQYGLVGEVVVADNGSTDGSQALAESLGARVVAVSERGYGAALRGGLAGGRGRFLIMGDCDGSYDFGDAVPMVGKLIQGADICMGSRLKGAILPGAMPWKNRYIGNPILTGILNLLFRSGISDAHCGLRALTRASFDRLALTGLGMEFASEMVIKAALKRERIEEVPITLHPDLRDRPPHLRPWRDGWRHLRYLFMLSPAWVYGIPGAVLVSLGAAILCTAGWHSLWGDHSPFFFGDYWTILAAAAVGIGHLAGLLGLATHLYGVREGYRRPKSWIPLAARWLTLETMLASGLAAIAIGFAILLAVTLAWFDRDLARAASVLPAVLGVLMLTLGAQNILGGFLLAILGGNEARFLSTKSPRTDAAKACGQPTPLN